MHLIRFPNRKERVRAIHPLYSVPREFAVITGPQFVVTDEHIQALEKAKVHFEYLSLTRRNRDNTLAV
jgi:hypothetical protein